MVSGLQVNADKSVAIPIRCSEDAMAILNHVLGCQVGSFPCKYLGLPLTLSKQTAQQFQGLVDQLAACLPTWRAASLPKSGRLLQVQSVLCAIPIHAMLVLDVPPRTIAAMIKICRGFLWCRKAKASGGNCVVAWSTVSAPKWAGGLGIPDLRWLNVSLQSCWPWLQRVDSERSWKEFNISVPNEALALFHSASRSTVGNGQSMLSWEDRWLGMSDPGDGTKTYMVEFGYSVGQQGLSKRQLWRELGLPT